MWQKKYSLQVLVNVSAAVLFGSALFHSDTSLIYFILRVSVNFVLHAVVLRQSLVYFVHLYEKNENKRETHLLARSLVQSDRSCSCWLASFSRSRNNQLPCSGCVQRKRGWTYCKKQPAAPSNQKFGKTTNYVYALVASPSTHIPNLYTLSRRSLPGFNGLQDSFVWSVSHSTRSSLGVNIRPREYGDLGEAVE